MKAEGKIGLFKPCKLDSGRAQTTKRTREPTCVPGLRGDGTSNALDGAPVRLSVGFVRSVWPSFCLS
jgi:hypothetical protein